MFCPASWITPDVVLFVPLVCWFVSSGIIAVGSVGLVRPS
jgi:hypothetical protein